VPTGVLLLDKPLGLSSNAALQRLRRLYGGVKAGHVGSLDPLASGMLPVCLGEATKVAGDILAGRKCYRFTVQLGASTTTGDAEGAVTATAAVPSVTPEALERALGQFRGPQQQVPPMYSAIKRGGEPLYRLARAGVTVAREPRAIHIDSLTLLAAADERLELQVLCSKGTYVRVLGEDIATALGTLGHLAALRRLYVEPFAQEPMHTLGALEARATRGEAPPLLAPDAPLAHLPELELDAEAARRVRLGQRLVTALGPAPRVRLYAPGRVFLGLGASDASGTLQPKRLLNG